MTDGRCGLELAEPLQPAHGFAVAPGVAQEAGLRQQQLGLLVREVERLLQQPDRHPRPTGTHRVPRGDRQAANLEPVEIGQSDPLVGRPHRRQRVRGKAFGVIAKPPEMHHHGPQVSRHGQAFGLDLLQHLLGVVGDRPGAQPDEQRAPRVGMRQQREVGHQAHVELGVALGSRHRVVVEEEPAIAGYFDDVGGVRGVPADGVDRVARRQAAGRDVAASNPAGVSTQPSVNTARAVAGSQTGTRRRSEIASSTPTPMARSSMRTSASRRRSPAARSG